MRKAVRTRNSTWLNTRQIRGLLQALIGALACAIPGAACAQFPASWTEPIEPFQIADNLFYVGTAALAAYLFTSEEGHVLIDAPLEENVPLLLANIRRLGFDPADIRVQLASHAHADHVGGLAKMLVITQAELALSEADGALVSRGTNFGADIVHYEPATPTRTLNHLDSVRVGNVRLVAHLTPGHTPGCTTWSGSVTIAEDSLEFVSVCSLSVLSVYRLVGPNETYAGQAADYCRSVEHLRSLTPDVFLGSHTAWFGMAEKVRAREAGTARAFVDPAGYQAYITRAAALIDQALTDQGVDGGCAALLEAH